MNWTPYKTICTGSICKTIKKILKYFLKKEGFLRFMWYSIYTKRNKENFKKFFGNYVNYLKKIKYSIPTLVVLTFSKEGEVLK